MPSDEVVKPTVISINSPSSPGDKMQQPPSSGRTEVNKHQQDGSKPSNLLLQVRHSVVGRSLSNKSSSQTNASATNASNALSTDHRKGRKLGHRRVLVDGEVTYKRIETSQLMGSIQLGIQQSVGVLAGQPDRDLLLKDFEPIASVSFTRDGLLGRTPAHNYAEFRFRTYAPFAFKKYRQMFAIDETEFLVSLCSSPMIELSNPGASGSIFYITQNDAFICKTVQHREADFLQKLLPGYYMNLKQNPRTLLPKFFGLYCYSCNAKNVRIIVMNNLLPSELKMHHRFDLKGSTYKRKANRAERAKNSPTYKDLDFVDMYPDGILLQQDVREALLNSIQRDCRVLESFKIMDYSLLIGIHNLDQAAREASEECNMAADGEGGDETDNTKGSKKLSSQHSHQLERQGSILYRERPMAHSTALESITMDVVDTGNNFDHHHHNHEQHLAASPAMAGGASSSSSGVVATASDDYSVNNVWGGIPAKNHKGENLLLFIGIIDILQEYGVLKKAEHYWKSLVHDGDSVSVHRPGFYARRFQTFMKGKVFKQMQLQSQPLPTSNQPPSAGTSATAVAGSSSSSSGGGPLGSSLRRTRLRRTMSKGGDKGEEQHTEEPKKENPASPSVVTVIKIGEDQVNLPRVLQDRAPQPQQLLQQQQQQQQKKRTSLTTSPKNERRNSEESGRGQVPTNPPPDVVADHVAAAATPVAATSPEPPHNVEDRLDTVSVITMTSDERVQIYVPSPQTTPYNTLTSRSALRDEHQQHVIQVRGSIPGSDLSPRTSVGSSDLLVSVKSDRHLQQSSPDRPSKSANAADFLPQGDTSAGDNPSLATSSTTAGGEETVIVTSETTTQETSPDMVRISIKSSSGDSHENEVVVVVAAPIGSEVSPKSEEATTVASQRTLMDDLPSLPTDEASSEQTGPISLSDVRLIDEEMPDA